MNDNKPLWLTELTGLEGRRLIAKVARWLGSDHDPDDLAQEVYIRLLRMKDQGSIRHPRAFAFRVAANILQEWGSLARNRYPHASDDLDTLVEDDTVVARIYSDQKVRCLNEALAKLSPRCRAVLLLNRRDHMSREEVAKHMGISVSMVKKYLSQGLAVCHQHLEESGHLDADS